MKVASVVEPWSNFVKIAPFYDANFASGSPRTQKLDVIFTTNGRSSK